MTKDNDSEVIIHEVVNKNFGIYRPHEWIFINILLEKCMNNIYIAYKFVAFQDQYYPEYIWKYYNLQNIKNMIMYESSTYNYLFTNKFKFQFKIDEDMYQNAVKFGNMATEFCIQYLNYSLIGISGNKTIVTASSNCDNEFDEFLQKGYALYRLPKIIYKNLKTDILGCFIELPVFPTNNIYYNNDEYIRSEETKQFMKVQKY